MKKIVAVLLVFLTVIVESTFLTRIQIRGIIPNLSIILIISYGLIEGPKWGRNLGLLIGLMQDVLFCSAIGFYTLLYFYLGHISGYGQRILRKNNLLIPLALIIAADLLYGFISYFFRYFLAGQADIAYYIRMIILPEAAYTSLWILPCYCILVWLNHRLSRYREKDTITKRLMNQERL